MPHDVPLFPSDIDLAKNPQQGTLRQPESDPAKRSLLSHTKPYYDGEFRILHRCAEFRLIQDYGPHGPKRVEWSYNIYKLYLKSTLKISGKKDFEATTWQERVNLATALDNLRSFFDANHDSLNKLIDPIYQHRDEALLSTPNGGLGSVRSIGATLGKHLSEMLRADDTEQAIKDLTNSFNTALRALARTHGRLEDKRTTGRPRPHHLISAATSIYLEFEQRPTKEAVEFTLTSLYKFPMKGKNAASHWRDLFNQAGLGGLPEIESGRQ